MKPTRVVWRGLRGGGPIGRFCHDVADVTRECLSPPWHSWSFPGRCGAPWSRRRERDIRPGNGWGRLMGWAGGTNRSVVDKREGDVQLLLIKHHNDFLKKYEYVNKKKNHAHYSSVKPKWPFILMMKRFFITSFLCKTHILDRIFILIFVCRNTS